MATWAAGAGVHVDEIRHSGKLRAQQTAEIFAKHLADVPAPFNEWRDTANGGFAQ